MSLPAIEAWQREPRLALWGILFLGLGLHLLTRVRRIEVDPNLRTVRYRSGYLIPWFTKKYSWNSVRQVELLVRIKKRRDKRKRSFWLAFKGDKRETVCRIRGGYFARSIGEHVATVLNVPLVDHITGYGQKRAARDLETPLVETWKNSGQLQDSPTLPPDSEFEVRETPDQFLLRFAEQAPVGKIVPVVFSLFLIPVIGAFAGVEGLEFAHSTFYRVFAFWCAAVTFMSLAFAARSTLRLRNNIVFFRQGLFPIRQSIPIDEIEQWVSVFDGVHLIGDNGQVFVEYSGADADRAYTRDALRYQLQRLGRAELQGASRQ